MTGTCIDCDQVKNLRRMGLCPTCYLRRWKAGTLPPCPPVRPPGAPQPCPHPVGHQHGTRTAYVLDKCRCDPCRTANTAARKVQTYAKVTGRCPLVDAEPARAHLKALADGGMGLRRIVTVSGVSRSTLCGIIYGRSGKGATYRPPRRRISRELAAKILAVRPDLADHALVDATGTVRRLQALVTLGWSPAELARRLGMSTSNLHVTFGQALVVEVTRRRITALYEQMWNTRPVPSGSATRARRYAEARSWAPPMAWDDETIDDPSASPQGVDEAPVRLSTADQVAELLALGYDTSEILARLGRDWSQVVGAIRDPQIKAELKRRAA